MEWKNRNGISLIGLISFVIFLVAALWLYIRNLEFQSQIAFILAEAAISIPITLILIEWVIKRDREKQWEKVKSLTYKTILFNISYVAYKLPMEIPFYLDGSKEFRNIIEKGVLNVPDPQKEVSYAILEFAEIVRTIQNRLLKENREQLGDDKWYDNMYLYSEMILKYNQETDWLLADIRLILIPRVLQLSDDQEVNSALLDFENHIRGFVYAMIEQQKSEEDLPVADLAIADLLEAIGKLYSVLGPRINHPPL